MQHRTLAVAGTSRLRRLGRPAAAIAALSVLALVGCAAGATGPAGTWTQSGDDAPRLVLNQDGTLTGDDGCNTLEGKWGPADSEIAFYDIASTLMACDGVDTWLGDLAAASIDGNTMTIRDASGAAIGELHRR